MPRPTPLPSIFTSSIIKYKTSNLVQHINKWASPRLANKLLANKTWQAIDLYALKGPNIKAKEEMVGKKLIHSDELNF